MPSQMLPAAQRWAALKKALNEALRLMRPEMVDLISVDANTVKDLPEAYIDGKGKPHMVESNIETLRIFIRFRRRNGKVQSR